MSARKPLGRGLAALIPGRDESLRTLPLAQLRPNRWQPRERFEEAGLEELAESIRTQGILQPIVVSPTDDGLYTIIAGERRYRAALRAGLSAAPVVVRQLRDERQLLELALVENLQRSDLNPVEEAEAYRTLESEFGLSHEEIARRVGKGRSAISNALRLLRLPPDLLELLRDGRLTAGQARPLLGLEDANEALRLGRRAASEGLSARDLESLAGREDGKRRKRRKPAPEANAAAAAEKLTRHLQTRVEIERRRRGGVVKIHFHSEEELMRLFDHLMATRGSR